MWRCPWIWCLKRCRSPVTKKMLSSDKSPPQESIQLRHWKWHHPENRVDCHQEDSCYQSDWQCRYVCVLSFNSWSRRLSLKLPRRRTHDILTRSSQHRPSLLRHLDKVAPHTHTHTQHAWLLTVELYCECDSKADESFGLGQVKMNCHLACMINFPPHPVRLY